ncbi:MAG: hypothetical protein JWM10_748 [Myxococcaceae bacterium]|nr:hypothetical protein [Myxococcaceae bacterium]
MTSKSDPMDTYRRSILALPWAEEVEFDAIEEPYPGATHEIPLPDERATTREPYRLVVPWTCGDESGQIRIEFRYHSEGVTLAWSVQPETTCTFWVCLIPTDRSLRPSWFELGAPAAEQGLRRYDIMTRRLGFDPLKLSRIEVVAE